MTENQTVFRKKTLDRIVTGSGRHGIGRITEAALRDTANIESTNRSISGGMGLTILNLQAICTRIDGQQICEKGETTYE